MRAWLGGWVGVALALASACGGKAAHEGASAAAPPPAPFSAGSRLQPVYWELDGQRLFRSFWDSERQEECSFRPELESGDEHHCLPVAAAENFAFADENCTIPTVDPAFNTDAKYVIVRPDNACSAPLRMFTLGSAAVAEAFYLDHGSCTALNIPGNQVYKADVEVSISDFVSAHEQPEATTRRIGALTAVSDDGAQQLLSGWDTQRQEASAPSPSAVWHPARVARPDASASPDASCQQPAVAVSCSVTAVQLYSAGPVNELGSEISSGLHLFDADTQSCDPWTPPPDTHYFSVGAEIPDSSFEPAHEVELGTGRIHVRYDAGTDSVPILPKPLLRDTQRDEDCAIFDLGGGQGRCLPQLVAAFGDNDCQKPVCVTHAGDPAPASCIVLSEGGTSPPVVYSAGVPRNGLVFRLEHGVCVFSGGDGEAIYDVGDPIPLEEFAAATAQGLPQ
jgi:hypothetical protein